jgi:hypothetical protein
VETFAMMMEQQAESRENDDMTVMARDAFFGRFFISQMKTPPSRLTPCFVISNQRPMQQR